MASFRSWLQCGIVTLVLKSLGVVPVFTQQGGMSCVEFIGVCPVVAMHAYVGRTSFELYVDSDPVYPFRHAFMSQVPSEAAILHSLVRART